MSLIHTAVAQPLQGTVVGVGTHRIPSILDKFGLFPIETITKVDGEGYLNF